MNATLRRMLVQARQAVFERVCARRRAVRCPGGWMSVTFDDVPAVTVDHGTDIFARHQAKGTFYVTGDWVGRDRFLTADQVRSLARTGHEIACHTFRHRNTARCLPRMLEEDLDRNRDVLGDLAGRDLESFSYPHGSPGLLTKGVVRRRFVSARGLCPSLNVGSTDMFALRTVKLYSTSLTVDGVEAFLDEAAAKAAWLIFTTHDVQPRPSHIGCTPHLLEAALSAARARGIEILPVRQAARRLQR